MPLPLAPPSGMRDLFPPESASRRALEQRLARTFELHGYQLVTTPLFEHAEVLERGLEAGSRRDLIRFVEPDSGEVALLRPDITPQIARLIATRLRDHPPPFRLYYGGTVFRRPRGRARRRRQIAQAGVECVGLDGPGGDAEVLEVATAALTSLGLEPRVELRHPRIAEEALSPLLPGPREAATSALLSKDRSILASALEGETLSGAERELLLALPTLFGGPETLERARSLGAAAAPLDELTAVAEEVNTTLSFDLGELRGRAYYTGVCFDILVDGPGAPVGRGGRYDTLLDGFGAPRPATGFALDLDHLASALETAGLTLTRSRVGLVASGLSRQELRALRSAGERVAEAAGTDPIKYASRWGFAGVVRRCEGGFELFSMDGRAPARCSTLTEVVAEAERREEEG